MAVYNEKLVLLNIGEKIFNQLLHPHLETASAKLDTDEELTEKEEMAIAIASGVGIKDCILDGDNLTIETQPFDIVKTETDYRVFHVRDEVGEAE